MSSQQGRERAIEAMLRAGVSPGASTPECLDPETLAAWVDGGLAPAARDRAEAHLAACGRCQLTMAALMDTPPVAPAEAGEERAPAWWHLDLRWLVPLAGAVAALLLWVIVPTGPEVARVQPDGNVARLPAQAEPAAPPAAAAPPPEAIAESPAEWKQTEPTGLEAQATRRRESPAGGTPEAARSSSADLLAKAERGPTEPAAAPAPEAAAPAAPRPQDAAAPAAPPQPAAVAEARESAELRQDRFSDASANAVPSRGGIVSRDPAVQWRLASSGVVERSVDGGLSWTLSDTGVASGLVAGSAPSAVVCWVVGRSGLVLVTTDGNTWRRLPAPTTEDLVSVEAPDDRQATVRSAAGNAFQTNDGGVTWRRLRE